MTTFWPCGAFQPDPNRPYRCTKPYGHSGPHEAVLDGQFLARWPQREQSDD